MCVESKRNSFEVVLKSKAWDWIGNTVKVALEWSTQDKRKGGAYFKMDWSHVRGGLWKKS